MTASSGVVLSTLMVFLESDAQRALIARECVRTAPGSAQRYECARKLATSVPPAAATALQLAAR